MGYELVIRGPSPEQKPAEAAILERLGKAAAIGIEAVLAPAATPSASEPPAPPPAEPGDAAPAAPLAEPLTLTNGNARLSAKLFRVDGLIAGTDLEVPFGGTEHELRQAFAFAQSLAEAAGGVVFDPQLGQTVGKSSADEVVARWRTSQSWLGNVAGVYEDPRAFIETPPPPPFMSGRTKWILLVVGGLLVTYWVIGGLIQALSF